MSRDDNDWWNKAPYHTYSENETFSVKWTGRCYCGKVKYRLSRDKPLDVKYCHCRDCQRMHGAPFQWAAIFEKTDICFVNGTKGLTWWDSSRKTQEHNLPCKVLCETCHAPIMDEGRRMILLFPTLIDDIVSPKAKGAFRVKHHLFYRSRVVDFKGDGGIKWSGLDNRSEELDDEGNVLGGGNKDRPNGGIAAGV